MRRYGGTAEIETAKNPDALRTDDEWGTKSQRDACEANERFLQRFRTGPGTWGRAILFFFYGPSG